MSQAEEIIIRTIKENDTKTRETQLKFFGSIRVPTAIVICTEILSPAAFPESGTQKPGAPRAAIHGDAAAVAGASGSRVSIGH
ncbi:Vacuolar Protein Sorting-Associated Protein 53-like [Manis pentadactyla]|nr:Vacuolar Protein Sorting-Associated Protein 53-like [Manis pentadactyla]